LCCVHSFKNIKIFSYQTSKNNCFAPFVHIFINEIFLLKKNPMRNVVLFFKYNSNHRKFEFLNTNSYYKIIKQNFADMNVNVYFLINFFNY